jgi:pyruvate dehydrogenase E1 component alpha subunit
MPAVRVDGNDVEAMYASVEAAVSHARNGNGPTYIEAMTYRLWGHMLGDPEIYRTKEEVAQANAHEPILRLARRLRDLNHTDADLARLEADADAIIADALHFAESSPAPQPAEAFADVFA